WLGAKDGEQQGNSRQRFLAAAHERDAAKFFAGRASDDVDTRFEHVVFILEHDISHAAAEKFAEELLEMGADPSKGLSEKALAVRVDLEDDLFERLLGGAQIVKLRLQRRGPTFKFLQLRERLHVDVPQLREFAA